MTLTCLVHARDRKLKRLWRETMKFREQRKIIQKEMKIDWELMKEQKGHMIGNTKPVEPDWISDALPSVIKIWALTHHYYKRCFDGDRQALLNLEKLEAIVSNMRLRCKECHRDVRALWYHLRSTTTNRRSPDKIRRSLQSGGEWFHGRGHLRDNLGWGKSRREEILLRQSGQWNRDNPCEPSEDPDVSDEPDWEDPDESGCLDSIPVYQQFLMFAFVCCFAAGFILWKYAGVTF